MNKNKKVVKAMSGVLCASMLMGNVALVLAATTDTQTTSNETDSKEVEVTYNQSATYRVMDSDSYAENNFVTCFVENSTDLSCLALNFSISNKDKLYAAGSNTPEESGKSFHDFSKGAIQFTVSGSDGTTSKSYW